MVLWVLRGLFVLLMAAVSFLAIAAEPSHPGRWGFLLMVAVTVFALVLVGVDLFLTRKSLAALSGAFLGLVVGMVFAYALGLIVDMMVGVFWGVAKG